MPLARRFDDPRSEPCPECDDNENGLFTRSARTETEDYRCVKCGHRWTRRYWGVY